MQGKKTKMKIHTSSKVEEALYGRPDTILLDCLPVGTYINTLGPKGRFLKVNAAMVAIFEAKTAAELLKCSVSDLHQDQEQRARFSNEVINKGYVRRKKLDLRTLKGNNFVASVTAVLRKDADGNQCLVGVIESISEHKRIEAALRLAESRLAKSERSKVVLEDAKQSLTRVLDDLAIEKDQMRQDAIENTAILQSIGEGVLAVDAGANLILVNKKAEELLGKKSEDLIGKSISMAVQLFDAAGRPIPADQMPTYQSVHGGKMHQVDNAHYFLHNGDGRTPVAIVATPLEAHGKIAGAISVLRDITEDYRIDQAKAEFVSVASHQLRTPLGIIKWYLEAIMKEASFSDKASKTVTEYMNEVHKNSERVIAVVRNLLSVSSIDQDKVKDAPKSTDVVHLVRDVIERIEILAHSYKVRIGLKVSDGKLPNMYIDPLRLSCVIENLVSNAIEYCSEPGKVIVTIQRAADHQLRLDVADTGMGMTADEMDKLFTKFFRSQASIAKKPDGSGLGLYIVKSYVDGWGGKITVESKKGKGSTFSMTLPYRKETTRNEKNSNH